MTVESKASKKRITPAQWTEANVLWESGESTLSDISKRLDITIPHLSREFKKNGIIKGSNAVDVTQAVEQEILSAAVESVKLRVKRIAETKEQHYVWTDVVTKMLMQSLAKARQENAPLAITEGDAKAADRVMSVLLKAQSAKWQCLGLDKEDFVGQDELPELPISNFTEEEILTIQNRAEIKSMGVDDGLGGTLAEIEENLIIEEGFDEDEDAVS